MGLATYRKKRNFAATPEPGAPRSVPTPRRAHKALSFVIQQHHATRAHFDFRLEMDGVLKSWAVPKGPSLDPADKRLAVEVEDHPLGYADFEGIIPAGQYGAGKVIVWDRGTYELQHDDDPLQAHRRGSLKITLHGEKLRGGWALVRMHTPGPRQNWLLIKERDRFAKPGSDITTAKPRSVVSGSRIEQIDPPKPRKRSRSRTAPSRSKAARRAKRTPSRASPRHSRKRAGHAAADIPGAVPGSPSASFRPQLATLVERVPPGGAWLHEVKFDGYRLLAMIDDARARLITRRGNDWTAKFPETRAAIEALGFDTGVLDGEIVALDEHGVSSFQQLQRALKDGRTGELVYFVFDIPFWDGSDLTACRLADRRAFLGALRVDDGARVRISEQIAGHGDGVLEQACRLHLEGVVSKLADSRYESARTTSWLKIKCTRRQEMVIAGYTEPKGTRSGLGAILVAYHDDAHLVYAGKVGTGFDASDLDSLVKRLKKMERDAAPVANPPRAPRLHWVEPKLVAEIGFTEWTADGRLRHPVFLGVREDKEASEVKRESPRSPRRPARPRKMKPSAPIHDTDGSTVAGVKISNPDRVVYPDMGLTKLQVARYYEGVADQILPHLAHRPLSLVRCPEGSSGECFFHKHLQIDSQPGLRAVPIEESKGTEDYVAVTALPGLIHLVQMNTLELHAWGARDDDAERPDRFVFDLDPGEDAAWAIVIDAARRLRALFEQLKLRSFVMTSGGKGLHVVIPVRRRLDWDHAKAFAHSVAGALAQAEPSKFVANMSKAKRRGKVFIDYLRVQRGATSIVPYSTRARAGAPVAMPIEWDAAGTTKPDAYTVASAPRHVAARRRDPWAGITTLRQSLPSRVLRGIGS